MFSWDYAGKLWQDDDETRGTVVPAAVFTAEEFVRLHKLRERYKIAGDCDEFGLDARRLRYVRWLVENGRIGEGVGGE